MHTDTTTTAAPTLRAEEVAKILRVGRSTVYRLMASGDLPYVSVGVGRGRHRRVTQNALDAYLAGRTTGDDPAA